MRLVRLTSDGSQQIQVCNAVSGLWEETAPAGLVGTQTLSIPLGNGVDVIAAGIHRDFQVPTAGQFTSWTILGTKFSAGSTGSMVADIWNQPLADFPPENADSITGSAPPTLTTAAMATSSTLTGWSTFFDAGDTFRINVDSAALLTLGTLILTYTPINPQMSAVALTIGDGVNDIPDGIWADVQMSVAGAWASWTLLATKPDNTAGDLAVDIWSQAYADFPPENAQSICGTDLPTLSTAVKATSSALTGWTTEFAAGDTFRINVDSSTTLKLATLVLSYTRAE